MKHTEILKFASILSDGLEKEAGLAGLAGGIGRFAGRGFGDAGRLGVQGAMGTARGLGRAAGNVGQFLTKERQNPFPVLGREFAQSARQSYAGIHPQSTGQFHGPTPYVPQSMPTAYMNPAFSPKTFHPAAAPNMPYYSSNPLLSTQFHGSSPAPTAGPSSGSNNYYDRFKTYWTSRTPVQKGALGYGALTAASLPSNYINNQHVAWQQQHPIMSWAGQTFGGMPNYTRRNYLMPSVLQR
jgi:hypothetical protein